MESLNSYQSRTYSFYSSRIQEPEYDIRYYSSDSEAEAVFEFELPGTRKEDIKVEIKNGFLILKAKITYLVELEEEDDAPEIDDGGSFKRYDNHQLNRYEEYSLTFQLPRQVDGENLEYKCYTDGVLILIAPFNKKCTTRVLNID